MNIKDYSFTLGLIGALEKKILPPHTLYDLLDSFDRDFSIDKIKGVFLKNYNFPSNSSVQEWEEIFQEELEVLREVCIKLFKRPVCVDILDGFEGKIDFDSLEDIKNRLLKEIVVFYLNIINTVNFLRIEHFGLEEDYYFPLPSLQEKIKDISHNYLFRIDEYTQRFYKLSKGLFEQGESNLVEILLLRILEEFLKKLKRGMDNDVWVFWFYFAKKLNITVLEYIIIGKFYLLEKDQIRRVIDIAYG